MMRRGCRLGATLLIAGAVGGLLAGCASPPRALGWHDTGVTQSLPMTTYPQVWAGVPLDNGSARPLTLETLHLNGVRNLVVGKPFVITVTSGEFIDWYSPPGERRMQPELRTRRPYAGFVVPPDSENRYEAVVLLEARRTDVAASITGATATYVQDGHEWGETWTEHSSLRLR